jgi:phage-related protein
MAINLPIVSKFDSTGVDQAKTGLASLSTSAKAMAAVASVALIGAAVAVADFGLSSLKAAAEAESVAKSLEQMAKNSGVFGDKANDIKAGTKALMDQSAELAKLTGIDDEIFSGLKRNWMSVPQLAATGANGLNTLAKVAADVSAGTGKDLESIGTAFTKAFASPETAIAKLQKAGVVLSDGQKQVYQSLVDTGKAAEAQSYLIGELGTKYAGAAEAAASPFERLKYILEDLKETVGAALLPAFNQLVDTLGPLFEKIGPLLAQAFSALTPLFSILGPLIDSVASAFALLAPTLEYVFQSIDDVVFAVLPLFMSIMKALMPVISALIPPLIDLAMAVLEPLIGILLKVVNAFAPLLDAILPPLTDLITAITPFIGDLMDALMPIIDIVLQLALAFAPLIKELLPIFVDVIKLVFEILKPFLPVIAFLANLIGDLLVGAIRLLMPVFEGLGKAIGWMYETFLKPLIEGLTQAFTWFTKLLGLDGRSVNIKTNAFGYASNTLPDFNAGRKMATGGVVMPTPGGMLARIAEAGKPEAVIPLDRLASMGYGGAGGATVNIVVNAGMGTNGAQVGEQIITAIKKYERVSGPVFASA